MTQTQGLFFDNVIKSFGGTRALNGVSLHIERGEVVALLGENGAGKSTLIKVLGGIYKADGGEVHVDGVRYEHVAGKQNRQQAVAFIHQDLGLIEWMSVAENIALAIGYATRGRKIKWAETEEIAKNALALVDADFPPTARISSLSRTEKSLVAIARALAVKCDFLVLDEPTASLPADEVQRLFTALRTLRDKGVGMIYVSHRLDEVFQIADRVAVLRDGEMVGMRKVGHTNPDDLVSLIVGRKTRMIERPEVQEGQAALVVHDFSSQTNSKTNFTVQRGEMLGLVGLRGAGHEAIGRALFGLLPYEGTILLDGELPDLSSPQNAVKSGFGFVARDRVVESVATGLSIRENIFLNPQIHGRDVKTLQTTGQEEADSLKVGDMVGLSPNDPALAIEALSGGNQQKIVVGRWMNTGRKFLIAEDPTAGVDVGAKAEIYQLLYDAMAAGMAVMVVSTDFEEIANICHRALVFSRGKMVSELSGVKLSTESLIQTASANEVA